MDSKSNYFFRIETLIVIIIFIAFSMNWIHYGKILNITGWGLPGLYQKTTKISNTIMFFAKKESPHLAKFIYIVPVLAIISELSLLNTRKKTANVFLLLTSCFGFLVSLYMYFYFISSKIFKLSNAGIGIHLLLGISIIGFIYSLFFLNKKNKKICEEQEDIQTEILE